MKPPPFVAWLNFEANLRTSGSTTDDFPLDLSIRWHIHIGYPRPDYFFPEGVRFCIATILKAFEPQPEPVLLFEPEDSSESNSIHIRDHDTRTITWYHEGLRGVVKSGVGLNESQNWQELPNPIYFRKLSNRHVPERFARTIRAFALAFPGRLRGDYSLAMRDTLSSHFRKSLPNPWSQS